MLEIVPSYHYMIFQEKLMNQTWENGKKLSFGPNFGTFSPNLGPKNFFHGFYLHQMLDIVAGYHCMQFQGKLMNRTSENDKIVLTQIWVPKKIFVDFTFARC